MAVYMPKIKRGASLNVRMEGIGPTVGIGTNCSTMCRMGGRRSKWRRSMIIVDCGWVNRIGDMGQDLLPLGK